MLQADINKLMEELDNIANTTSFNGKQLLSGILPIKNPKSAQVQTKL